MNRKRAFLVLTGVLAAVFLLLGGLFVCAPEAGAAIYGVPGNDRSALIYVRAVAIRDLALSAYLIGLARAENIRALTILCAATIVIPIGDMALLMLSGTGGAPHYFLHMSSLLCFAATALWGHRLTRR
ncbi:MULTISPECIES: DUF4267 domain-containing protein [Sphingomonas]|jgi:hypothetical protein|uniref:DUF4267 domain-containing protein n=1 Tax=Sphingomonas zeae TaxID=1646122 RepID=A0A7Y6B5W5_9SPHN|nr:MULTISPECIES: DUF4267 domain-containing protein [Sphingomonas]MBB4049752.1 hypothetical protein [Sphingomonas zeae]MDK8185780.1 DUF4267 domain-containing protein [Sphingomonas zeae]MDK8215081.1 DUF4267 domain-containing protein [Sphingomonas sp. UMB7805-LC452B]NUU47808.1 DUF4267 domain-containing protein [Sphingomonas zeae]